MVNLGTRLAEVAHELKVPLSLIVGSLDQLEANLEAVHQRAVHFDVDASDPELARAIETASALLDICRRGAERLERVVQQVADYSRSGREDLAAGRVDLPRLLRTAADLVGRTASPAPRLVLAVDGAPSVRGDEEALGRVFVNVLRNAADALVGHADPTVYVTAVTSEPAGDVEVRVRDNGPGIAPRDRPRVFEPFYSGSRTGGGLGLGLAIARDIVEGVGGTIAVASAPGTGAEFVIRLPVAP